MIDISRAFSASSETVSGFFQRPGVGFYIPLYQREYSWDKENIDQLIEDICLGVRETISSKNNSPVIRFLGTIILVKESNQDNIDPKDKKALPSRIDKIIDGQQRISTIALLACLLYQKLYQITQRLPNSIRQQGLQEAVDNYLAILVELFSVDLRRGSPQRKPIVVRGSVDRWTFDGDDNNYKSDVASFLAQFIRSVQSIESQEKPSFPKTPKGSLVGSNLRQMNFLLRKVEKSHENNSDEFVSAETILDNMSEVDLWSYERPELSSIIKDSDYTPSKNQSNLCSLVQLFAFCHYLIDRCCFTLIEPVSDDWAFDMFQSLNATGTPLTAIETFKPLVVNYININSQAQNKGFKDSKSEKYFSNVDKLLGSSDKSASSKNKLTNDYLSLFGSTYNGKKEPARRFSTQRKWLINRYDECGTFSNREEFIHAMSDIAMYWQNIIIKKGDIIPRTENILNSDLRKQAALCTLYLQKAGHKMAHSVLSRFYSLILREENDADIKFVLACRKVAAFFTLWRSALDNTGLDDVYRELLNKKISWKKGNLELDNEVLKQYFLKVLEDKNIGNKNSWKNKAIEYLRYDNAKIVCRFSLFVTAHDTIPDPDSTGMMKKSLSGVCSYLEPDKWNADDFSSIEHIAPQERSNDEDWDENLYSDENNYEKIGNLTLLPVEINSSVGNKVWAEKWIYYKHLAEADPDCLENLQQEAENYGISLSSQIVEKLRKTSHNHHVKSIVNVGITGTWDKSLVDKRTERICDILWERMYKWLTD